MKVAMSNLRYWSALVLAVVLAFMFWLTPHMTPSMLGADTPERAFLLATGFFLVLWVYLLIQGYPISHGDIGSSTSHNLDNIMSALPGIVALFGVLLTVFRFWPLSNLLMIFAAMVIAAVWYDLWILGGAAAKINRLTDEIKTER